VGGFDFFFALVLFLFLFSARVCCIFRLATYLDGVDEVPNGMTITKWWGYVYLLTCYDNDIDTFLEIIFSFSGLGFSCERLSLHHGLIRIE